MDNPYETGKVSRVHGSPEYTYTTLLAWARPLPLLCGWRRECWVSSLSSAARRGALDGSGRGASRHSTHGLRPGSNKGLTEEG